MSSIMRAYLVGLLVVDAAFALHFNHPKKYGKHHRNSTHVPKTNLIYVLADDLGYGELGCYGQKIIKTPYLDRMAAEGMRFTDHYSGSPVCSPSRCSLMTGKHAGHASMINNRENNDKHFPEADKGARGEKPLHAGEVTIANLAKNAGYRTGIIGKWGLGGRKTTGDPNNVGFDHFFGFYDQREAHHYYTDWLWRNGEPVELKDNPKTHKWYTQDLFHNESEKFIQENKDNPFFLYLNPTIPHAELIVPDDSLAEYADMDMNDTVPWGDKKPYQVMREAWGLYNYVEKPHHTQAAMISRLDRDMGRIMRLLKNLGIDRHTLIMFSSDNGASDEGGADPKYFNSTGVFSGIKRYIREGGIRVPMIAWQPGKIKAGSVSNHISAFWDIMPTASELFGTACPDDSDGISMLPTLYGTGNQNQHEYLYWRACGQRGVRKGKWKLLGGPGSGDELFDLEADPSESTHMQKEHPDVLQDLKAIIAKFENHTDL